MSAPPEQVTTTYIQQEHHPGGWEDHAETDDREVAESRSFAASRGRATRLIERTERVLAEAAAQKKNRR
jgi:hypothetical protein